MKNTAVESFIKIEVFCYYFCLDFTHLVDKKEASQSDFTN